MQRRDGSLTLYIQHEAQLTMNQTAWVDQLRMPNLMSHRLRFQEMLTDMTTELGTMTIPNQATFSTDE